LYKEQDKRIKYNDNDDAIAISKFQDPRHPKHEAQYSNIEN